MEHLHRSILSMCSTVEELIHDSVDGLRSSQPGLARELSGRDGEVDEWDIRIEEECLKILALYPRQYDNYGLLYLQIHPILVGNEGHILVLGDTLAYKNHLLLVPSSQDDHRWKII
jgi:hypothetical protein